MTMTASPFTKWLLDVIRSAYGAGASDLHIEPGPEGLAFRQRVHGLMRTLDGRVEPSLAPSFMRDAKRALGLNVAASGRAQDGRVSLADPPVDIRASLLPVLHGEKIVLRLLSRERQFDLDALGLDRQVREAMEAALGHKNGVIIVSGPTGSGKSTTLYGLICSLDPKTQNIVTIEDPPEYTLAGVHQVPVTGKVGFADALRAILRQDPDVILVGEIRDEETAALCIKAAATGHLVLSTLHANSAVQVVDRLLGLGVDRFMLESTLKFATAQRLVPTICRLCSLPAPTSLIETVAKKIGRPKASLVGEFWMVAQGTECGSCTKGITGRLPVVEFSTQGRLWASKVGGDPTRTDPDLSLQEAVLRFASEGTIDIREVVNIA